MCWKRIADRRIDDGSCDHFCILAECFNNRHVCLVEPEWYPDERGMANDQNEQDAKHRWYKGLLLDSKVGIGLNSKNSALHLNITV
jgi:hypothetical protein